MSKRYGGCPERRKDDGDKRMTTGVLINLGGGSWWRLSLEGCLGNALECSTANDFGEFKFALLAVWPRVAVLASRH